MKEEYFVILGPSRASVLFESPELCGRIAPALLSYDSELACSDSDRSNSILMPQWDSGLGTLLGL